MDARLATSDGAAAKPIGRERPPGGDRGCVCVFLGEEQIFLFEVYRLKVKVIMIFWIRGLLGGPHFFFGGEKGEDKQTTGVHWIFFGTYFWTSQRHIYIYIYHQVTEQKVVYVWSAASMLGGKHRECMRIVSCVDSWTCGFCPT